MNCRAIRHTIFAAGMVFVSSTFAGTEIIKCTDDAGHVTRTDQSCKGEDAAQVLVADAAPAAAAAEGSDAAPVVFCWLRLRLLRLIWRFMLLKNCV